uniref:Uncharacterized protein n=1 Tax=Anguilla anguilla TaxID=7936 RepID=A0A0E9VVF8_ANGAN
MTKLITGSCFYNLSRLIS